MGGLTIRPAVAADLRRIAEIVGEPGPEAVPIVGNKRLARKLGIAVIMLPGSIMGWPYSTVAELDGKVVGVLQAGTDLPPGRLTWAERWTSLRILGPIRVLQMIPRVNARMRVQHWTPKGTYHINEIDVDPEHRNKGVGGALLDWAEEQARNAGVSQMSLTTYDGNPAVRLYQRHGFYIADTKTDAAYERLTGIKGRHLMLKDLT
jgi:ribosomal protein S18 acetylase RimI-like enzyme